MPHTRKNLKPGRGKSPTRSQTHRLKSVRLVLGGKSASEVARESGDSFSIVARWVRQYREGGAAALTTVSNPGRPKALAAGQLEKIRRYVSSKQSAGRAITGAELAQYAKSKFGASISLRNARRMLLNM